MPTFLQVIGLGDDVKYRCDVQLSFPFVVRLVRDHSTLLTQLLTNDVEAFQPLARSDREVDF